MKDFVLDTLPVIGTYRAYQVYKDNPSIDTALDLGASALSDILLPFGVGGYMKAYRIGKTANKARKLYQAANKLNNKNVAKSILKKADDLEDKADILWNKAFLMTMYPEIGNFESAMDIQQFDRRTNKD